MPIRYDAKRPASRLSARLSAWVAAMCVVAALSATPSQAADAVASAKKAIIKGRHTVISIKDGPWSKADTWKPGRVPKANDRVLIQRGTHVIYDVQSNGVLRSVRVAGTLTFARDRDTELNVGLVTIQPSADDDSGVEDVHKHDHGHKPHGDEALLAVGLPGQPVAAGRTARIRLHHLDGMNAENEPAIIARPGGRFELHGSPMNRTWVKLGATAQPGDGSVTLRETVTGWRVGDSVIVTASKREKGPQTEQRTIKAIDGATLTLDKPLEFEHFGVGDFRSEVANLSRNVIVESADPSTTAGRGHTMYHWGSAGSISYARFAHLGKKGVLGRYPIHFHLVEDTMRGSSVVGAAVVDSHNRWVTIHGTQYLLVRDCVGYKSVGHGYFLEDATEVYNLLDRNLAVQAKVGPRMKKQALPFDPNDGAGFWWSNGRNSFTRNVSCENEEYGYRYDMRHSRYLSSTMPIRQADGSLKEVDVRTIPIWRFSQNEAHTEGFYGMVVAANGGSQPDSPIRSEKQLAYFRRIDWTGPDTKHPHTITDLTIWGAHYAFRPHSPAMLMENVRLHDAAYGVYRPAFENHVYRNLHISRMAAEPFNRGMDDASAQTGIITVDGLTFTQTGYGNNRSPLIHMSDNNLSGDAAVHIRNLRVERDERYKDRWPTFNIGGGARADPITDKTVPYFIHDHFGEGRHAKVVTVKAKDHLGDGNKYESDYPLTGPEARITEVSNVAFPKVLDPVDDHPPATTVLRVTRDSKKTVVRGVSHDNGKIVKVLVNGQEAALTRSAPGVVDWQVELTGGIQKIEAKARDEAGNVELTPHVIDRD